MVGYDLPQLEVNFLLDEVVPIDPVLTLPGYEDCERDMVPAIVDAIGRFAKEKLLPVNAAGDQIGAQLVDGDVKATPGFEDAYKVFCDDGWNALALSVEFGGQQLPFMLHAVLREAMAGTNLAFALLHELNFGVYEALEAHGSPELQALYLPPLVEGRWAGTMCLTEPHCGTDLGLIRTGATPQADGSYALKGNKIFITWGDHDMSENIVHLVLARIEGAVEGIKGLSLFVVPKYIPDENAQPGERNAVSIVGLEEKMGLHGSPTCSVAFECAKGWLVGEEGKGLNAMFVMMNAARLSVGLQGLGICETAYQSAMAYANERLQGRSPDGEQAPDQIADPLTAHPDMRRRLRLMQSQLGAARALCYWGAQLLDEAHRECDADKKAHANRRLAALTPVLKSYVSDLGSAFAHEAVQTYGGHGYVRDHGVEQLSRDVRITEIYEGTNAVQGVDLAMRKLRPDGGETVASFVADIREEVQLASAIFPDRAGALAEAADRLEAVSQYMVNAEPKAALSGASDYLDLLGATLSAMFSLKMARVASQSSSATAALLKKEKVKDMQVFFARILPKTLGWEAMIMAGDVGDAPLASTHLVVGETHEGVAA